MTAAVTEIRPGVADVASAPVATPPWLLHRLAHSPGALVLWRHLADHHVDATGQCHPRRVLLADELGTTPESITRRLNQLVEVGALVREPRWVDDGMGGKPYRDASLLTLLADDPEERR